MWLAFTSVLSTRSMRRLALGLFIMKPFERQSEDRRNVQSQPTHEVCNALAVIFVWPKADRRFAFCHALMVIPGHTVPSSSIVLPWSANRLCNVQPADASVFGHSQILSSQSTKPALWAAESFSAFDRTTAVPASFHCSCPVASQFRAIVASWFRTLKTDGLQ